MLNTYIVLMTLGLIMNFILNCYNFKRRKIKNKHIMCINIMQGIMLILGCKILDIIVNFKYYIYKDLIESTLSGYMFYGGIILSNIYIFLYCKIEDINIIDIFSNICPNTLVLYSIWKIGCFVNGCCNGINNFPIQLCESALCLLLYVLISKNKKGSWIIAMYYISFGIIRAIAFMFRDEIDISNLIVNEIISICFILWGIFYYSVSKRKG